MDLEPMRLEGMEDFDFPAELCVDVKGNDVGENKNRCLSHTCSS